jgi:hypothetical protein
VFESTNGGQTWIDHDNTTFNFSAHADLLFGIGPKTWMVGHGTTYPNNELHRTIDGGATWHKVADNLKIGGSLLRVGSAVYATSSPEGGTGLHKTTDDGATWTQVPNAVTRTQSFAIAMSATKLYVFGANDLYDTGAELRWAPIDDDSKWSTIALPPEMSIAKPDDGGWTIGSTLARHSVVTSDGTHTIIVTSNHNGGVWRYVEP